MAEIIPIVTVGQYFGPIAGFILLYIAMRNYQNQNRDREIKKAEELKKLEQEKETALNDKIKKSTEDLKGHVDGKLTLAVQDLSGQLTNFGTLLRSKTELMDDMKKDVDKLQEQYIALDKKAEVLGEKIPALEVLQRDLLDLKTQVNERHTSHSRGRR